jgi:TatD DNase family protein
MGSKAEFVDTHCHLNFNDFDLDRDSVIERALSSGITRILIPGLDLETSKAAISLTHINPEVYAAVGLHPNESRNWSANTIHELRILAADDKVVAIGEIGLDYYRDRSPKEHQQSIFKGQLELAAQMGLPVIIHNRDTSEDTLRILQEWHSLLVKSGLELAHRPGVLHSFSGDETFANEVIALNFKLGIAGPVTFTKKSENLQALVKTIKLEHLLLETDSPFLTPHPHRGKRNEPANVRIVAEKISELKGSPLDEIAKITTETANKLFRWSESR